MWPMHCLAQCDKAWISRAKCTLCLFTGEQASPCYSVAQCSPCFAWVQSLRVLPGWNHSMFCLGAITPCFAWVQSLHVLPGCNHSMFSLGAITPCFAWVQLLHVLQASEQSLQVLRVCNHSILCRVQSLHVLPGCNHHMYCGLRSSCWAMNFLFCTRAIAPYFLGCNNSMSLCLARA